MPATAITVHFQTAWPVDRHRLRQGPQRRPLLLRLLVEHSHQSGINARFRGPKQGPTDMAQAMSVSLVWPETSNLADNIRWITSWNCNTSFLSHASDRFCHPGFEFFHADADISPELFCKQLKTNMLLMSSWICSAALRNGLKDAYQICKARDNGISYIKKFGKYLGEGTSRGEQPQAAPLNRSNQT